MTMNDIHQRFARQGLIRPSEGAYWAGWSPVSVDAWASPHGPLGSFSCWCSSSSPVARF